MAITPVKWEIVQQEKMKYNPETDKKDIFVGMVDCLDVYTLIPDKKSGDPDDMKPVKILSQIVIGNGKGGTLTLRKLNRKSNLTPFGVIHPSKMEHKIIKCGLGKNARYAPDTLNPEVEVKGDVERYNESEFRQRVERFLQNPELMAQILSMLNGDE